MKRLWILMALLMTATGLVRAQTNFIVMDVRTGVDEANGDSLITYGLPDTNWTLVAVSGNTNPGTLPRSPIVVNREQDWHPSIPIPDTRTISVGTNYGGADNQYLAPQGFYTFRYSFFIDFLSLTNWTVEGSVWADDAVEVFLNGNRILTTSVIWNQPAVSFTNNNQSYWLDGTNILDFRVYNASGSQAAPLPVGLDANLLITAVPEPKTAGLAVIGLIGVLFNLRRRRARS